MAYGQTGKLEGFLFLLLSVLGSLPRLNIFAPCLPEGAGKTYTISNMDPETIGMNTRCVAGEVASH
jgi:hypothetical protein